MCFHWKRLGSSGAILVILKFITIVKSNSYDEKNKYIIEKLKDAKGKERSARFVCAMAVAFPNGEIETCRGTIEGLIGYEQKGKNGFGYDPIVYVPEYEMTTGEMAPELKNSISHRGKALEQMKEILKRKLDLN